MRLVKATSPFPPTSNEFVRLPVPVLVDIEWRIELANGVPIMEVHVVPYVATVLCRIGGGIDTYLVIEVS